MWFSREHSVPPPARDFTTLNGNVLEQVTEYKYLGIWLDSTPVSFSHYISRLQSKVKAKIVQKPSFPCLIMVMSYVGQHARAHYRNLVSGFLQMLRLTLTTVLYIPLSIGYSYKPVVIFTGSCLSTKTSLVCPPLVANYICCPQHLFCSPKVPKTMTVPGNVSAWNAGLGWLL